MPTSKRKLFCCLCGGFMVAIENQGEAIVWPYCRDCNVEYEIKYSMSASSNKRACLTILLDPKLTDEAKKLTGV